MGEEKKSTVELEASEMLQREDISNNAEETHKHCCGFLRINLTYLPIKLLYLFIMAGQASCLIYLNLFMRHLGLSTSQVGLINASQRILGIFTPPICGAISDKTEKPKTVLISILMTSAVLVFSMVFVPIEDDVRMNSGLQSQLTTCKIENTETTVQCNVTKFNETHTKVSIDNVELEPIVSNLPTTFATTINTLPDDEDQWYANNVYEVTVDKVESSKTCFVVNDERNAPQILCDASHDTSAQMDQYGVTFWLMTILFLLTAVTFNGTLPVVEATTFAILGPRNKHKHGQQRLWASVGFGSAAFIIGLTKTELDKLGSEDTNIAYVPIFAAAFIFLLLSALISYKLPVAKPSTEPVSLANVKIVMKNPKMILFLLLLVFPYGTGNAVLLSYAFWFVEDKLNAPSTIIGLASLCGSLLDIPCFYASGWLVRKFRHNSLLVFAAGVLSLRLFFIAELTEAWQLILVEGARGITWGLGWAVICSFTSSVGPPQLRATTVGIVYATSHGIGFAVGALVGGVVYQNIGREFLFTATGCFLAVNLSLYAVAMCWHHFATQARKRRERNKAKQEFESKDDEAFS